jgi:hypothetical protein
VEERKKKTREVQQQSSYYEDRDRCRGISRIRQSCPPESWDGAAGVTGPSATRGRPVWRTACVNRPKFHGIPAFPSSREESPQALHSNTLSTSGQHKSLEIGHSLLLVFVDASITYHSILGRVSTCYGIPQTPRPAWPLVHLPVLPIRFCCALIVEWPNNHARTKTATTPQRWTLHEPAAALGSSSTSPNSSDQLICRGQRDDVGRMVEAPDPCHSTSQRLPSNRSPDSPSPGWARASNPFGGKNHAVQSYEFH